MRSGYRHSFLVFRFLYLFPGGKTRTSHSKILPDIGLVIHLKLTPSLAGPRSERVLLQDVWAVFYLGLVSHFPRESSRLGDKIKLDDQEGKNAISESRVTFIGRHVP